MITGYPHTSQALAALGLAPEQLSPGDRAAYERVKAHDDRIAAILEANGGEVTCPRCNRPTMGWPFKQRPDKCGGKDAVYCIRDPEAALADIARRADREG
jgi:DNA-binding transcriptional regulator YdaS (Cro superfamily)